MNNTNQNISEETIKMKLKLSHPLIKLKNLIPWEKIKEIVDESLIKDNRGLSRDLDHHIRALILIMYFNCTYRELVEILDSNFYARFFCDLNENDNPYGHTVYMKFVNELSLEGFEKINFMFIDIAKKKGSRKLKILM